MSFAPNPLSWLDHSADSMTIPSSGCSGDSLLIEIAIQETKSHINESFLGYQNQLIVKFNNLKSKWISETQFISSLTDVYMNPSYQKIISLGPSVLPYILHELKKEPNWWFWALEVLTDENPVNPEHLGDIQAMTADWLSWAGSKHYLS